MTNELVNAVLESNQASKDGNRTFSMSKGKIGLNIQVGGPFDSLENFGSAFLDLKKEQRDFNLDTTINVGKGVVGAVKGIPRGIINFAEEFNRTLLPGYNENVVPWMNENIPGLKELNDFTANMLEYDNKAQTIGGQYIGEPVSNFIIPGATISKSAQAMGMGNKFLANVLGYGTAEAIAVPADEQAMISMGLDLALPNSEIKSLILEGLQADEDAAYIIQKLQKAPENFLGGGYLGEKLDQAISSIGTLYTRIKNSPKLNEMKNNVTESLIKAGDDAQARIDENKGSTQLNTGVDPTDQGLALPLQDPRPGGKNQIVNGKLGVQHQAGRVKRAPGCNDTHDSFATQYPERFKVIIRKRPVGTNERSVEVGYHHCGMLLDDNAAERWGAGFQGVAKLLRRAARWQVTGTQPMPGAVLATDRLQLEANAL